MPTNTSSIHPHDDASFDPAEIEAGGPVAAADEADAFEIGAVSGFSKTADQIEEESSFDEVPPGEWELYVAGFLAPPKREDKTVYLAGRRVSFSTHSVVVKLARADAPGQQVTDYFLLPPDDPAAAPAYFQGASNPEGKGAGFNANKFYHFIDRLGFAVPQGGALPPEARRLGNWRRRRIVAKVEPGRPYTDQTTGEEKAGRNQVKLFSYRPAGSPAAGAKAAPPHAASARRAGAPGGQQQLAASGLDNI